MFYVPKHPYRWPSKAKKHLLREKMSIDGAATPRYTINTNCVEKVHYLFQRPDTMIAYLR